MAAVEEVKYQCSSWTSFLGTKDKNYNSMVNAVFKMYPKQRMNQLPQK
jgi:hypothetical protein